MLIATTVILLSQFLLFSCQKHEMEWRIYFINKSNEAVNMFNDYKESPEKISKSNEVIPGGHYIDITRVTGEAQPGLGPYTNYILIGKNGKLISSKQINLTPRLYVIWENNTIYTYSSYDNAGCK